MNCRLILALLFFCWWTTVSATRPLFTPQELKRIEKLKKDKRVILDQILDLKKQDKEYFHHVLKSTSKEDLLVLRKFLPQVLNIMEKSEESIWLKQALEKITKD